MRSDLRLPLRSALCASVSEIVEFIVNGDGSYEIMGWEGDADTIVSNAAGRIRGTLSGAQNPRVYQEVSGLTIGLAYHFYATVRSKDDVENVFIRVNTNPLGFDSLISYENVPSGTTVNTTFTATATTHYVVAVTSTAIAGEYVEIDNVSLTT